MGFLEPIWTAVNNTITGAGGAVPLTLVAIMSNAQSHSSEQDSLLSIPIEVRLMIYELSVGDIYSEPKFNNDHCYSRRNNARREAFDVYFNVLLVNKQLNGEARHIFYQHHLRQLRQSRQIYYICQTSKPATTALGTPVAPSPSEWKWQLGIHSLWTSNCSSIKALADLQLPELGLALWHPQHSHPSKHSERQSTEQLAALKIFAEELATTLKGNSPRTRITIHIDKQARRSPGQAIFHALAPLRASCEQADVSFMNHGAIELDDWMVAELRRGTGLDWGIVLLDSRREREICHGISERLRLRNIRSEVLKDLQLRAARGLKRL